MQLQRTDGCTSQPTGLSDLSDDTARLLASFLDIPDRMQFASMNKYTHLHRADLMGEPPTGFTSWPDYCAWRKHMLHSDAPMTVAARRTFQPAVFVTRGGDLFGVNTNPPGSEDAGVPGNHVLLLRGVRGVSTSDFASFSMAVTHEGHVYTWGTTPADFGNFGQYGTGDAHRNWAVPGRVQSLAMHRITCASAGSDHLLAVAETGEVFSWGCNHGGQCGRPPGEEAQVPQRVEALCHVRARNASAGAGLSTVVTEDGHVYAFGQFDDTAIITPYIVHFPPEVVIKTTVAANNMFCDDRHCLALTTDGRVYDWTQRTGPDQILFPDGVSVRAINLYSDIFGAVTTEGKLFMWGAAIDQGTGRRSTRMKMNLATPTRIECFDGKDVTAIAMSYTQTLVHTRDGAVFGLVPALPARPFTGPFTNTQSIVNTLDDAVFAPVPTLSAIPFTGPFQCVELHPGGEPLSTDTPCIAITPTYP